MHPWFFISFRRIGILGIFKTNLSSKSRYWYWVNTCQTPIPIPGSCWCSIPIPIPGKPGCSIPIPIPIPENSDFQYQYQYRPEGQYLNTNTRYCGCLVCTCLLVIAGKSSFAARAWWLVSNWVVKIMIEKSLKDILPCGLIMQYAR